MQNFHFKSDLLQVHVLLWEKYDVIISQTKNITTMYIMMLWGVGKQTYHWHRSIQTTTLSGYTAYWLNFIMYDIIILLHTWRTPTYIHTQPHKYTHMYLHTHIHTYIVVTYTHTYAYTYWQTWLHTTDKIITEYWKWVHNNTVMNPCISFSNQYELVPTSMNSCISSSPTSTRENTKGTLQIFFTAATSLSPYITTYYITTYSTPR